MHLGDGSIRLRYGSRPIGVLIYDAHGHMSVHLMSGDRAPFASGNPDGGTALEMQAAFDSYLGYFGGYTIDAVAGTVSHSIEGCSYPNWAGTTQKRIYSLEGKRLKLSTPPMMFKGGEATFVLIWERTEEEN